MATNRVAFIPWNEAQAGNFKTEYEDSHADRKYTHHKRKWKIVLYEDRSVKEADRSPGARRVLTIMLASEY